MNQITDRAESDRPTAHSDLQLADEIRYQRRTWAIQRVAVIAMFVVLLVGVAGGLGNGRLSRRVASDRAAEVRIHYDSLPRADAPTELRIVWTPSELGKVEVIVSRDYLRSVRVEEIVPTPIDSAVGHEGFAYTFAVSERSSAEMVFRLRPLAPGRLDARVIVAGHQVDLSQFVLP